MMTFATVCSGIEAPSLAWPTWKPLWFSEIEPFCCALLSHYYPDTPNLGDMTRIQDVKRPNVFMGGTPCQSFSVAGLRRGMADPRGNLALVFLGLVDRLRPRWVVWENVPGVLSSNKGRDFGAFLGGLAECGYGFAYRVLDAQFVRVESHARAVPQRRRRVFVVGCLGDWRSAAAVLFERASMSGDSPPRRQPRERVAGSIASRTTGGGGLGTDFDLDGGLIPSVSLCLNAGGMGRTDSETETMIPAVARTLNARHDSSACADRGMDLVPIAFSERTRDGHSILEAEPDSVMPSLKTGSQRQQGVCYQGVRRLTPLECERLQGMPDNYTAIPYRGKPACDGPRYKAIGNSIAVNVLAWIGQRIEAVDDLT